MASVVVILAISSLHLAQYSARPAVPACLGVYLLRHCSVEYGGSNKTPQKVSDDNVLRYSRASI